MCKERARAYSFFYYKIILCGYGDARVKVKVSTLILYPPCVVYQFTDGAAAVQLWCNLSVPFHPVLQHVCGVSSARDASCRVEMILVETVHPRAHLDEVSTPTDS